MCGSMADIHSATAEIRRGKKIEVEMWANMMAALPNIGVHSVQRRKVWLPTAGVPCSNAAKTRNPLKFARVPQYRQQFSAVIGPNFTILRGHVEEVLMFNKLFSDWRCMP